MPDPLQQGDTDNHLRPIRVDGTDEIVIIARI